MLLGKLESSLSLRDRLPVKVGVLVYSLFAVAGLYYYLSPFEFGPNFVFVLIIPLLYALIRSCVNSLNAKVVGVSLVLSFLYACLLVWGGQCEIAGQLDWSKSTLVSIALLTLFIEAVVFFLFVKLDNMMFSNGKIEWTLKKKIILYLMILLPQLFIFLVTFPGVYGYDGGFHILQIMDPDTEITSKYSVLYTVLLGGLVRFGNEFFNSAVTGFALCMVIQCFILSFVAYRVTRFTYDLARSIAPMVISVAFFSFCPLYLILTVSSAQDVLFGAFFLLLFVEIVEFARKDDWLASRRHLITFVSSALLMTLFRNNGVYVLLFVFAIVLFVSRGIHRRKMTVALAIPIVLCLVITGPLYSLFNISSGNAIREMASIPSQQIARACTENPAGLTEAERQLVDKYYDVGFEYYSINPSISDVTKGALKEEEIKKDPFGYIQLYVSLGIKEPGNYFEAFLMNTLGFWYPNKIYPDTRMYHPFIEYEMLDAHKWNEKYVDIERSSLFPLLDRGLVSFIEDATYQNLPIASTFFTNATYFFFFLFVIAYAIVKKERALVIPLSLIVGLYITYLLSPVCLFRYCYAFMICFPVLVALLVAMVKGNFRISAQGPPEKSEVGICDR